jgi:hypothetical protein
MAELKTKVNDASVEEFLNTIDNDQRRADAFAVLKLMRSVTRQPPRMWGPSIVGFDRYHYKYESGREGDMCRIGFSPRRQALTLYLMDGYDRQTALMNKLGKYTTGRSCLYIKRLEDVDLTVLRQLIEAGYSATKRTHPAPPGATSKTGRQGKTSGAPAPARGRRSGKTTSRAGKAAR